jgi:WD40 repeat protein
MDRLICCTSGPTLFVYSYELNAAAHNDISKHKNRFQLNYKLVHTWTAAGQQVTSLACWNNTYSPYLVVGSTNRSVQIFDAAAMQTAHVYGECHSKAVSHVALPTPSQTASVPQDKYTFFATCAADSTVRLWDVRSSSALATLSEHLNNREAIACDISPCLTHVAVGSEDGRSYVYDTRTMRSVAVLPV